MPINIDEAILVGLTNGKSINIISKEWGCEHILPGFGYTTKIMEVKPGFECSLHFHRNKNETFVLVQGQLYVTFYEPDSKKHTYFLKKPLSSLVLPSCTPHTFHVPQNQEENTIFIESSTEDSSDDNYRLTKSKYNAKICINTR